MSRALSVVSPVSGSNSFPAAGASTGDFAGQKEGRASRPGPLTDLQLRLAQFGSSTASTTWMTPFD